MIENIDLTTALISRVAKSLKLIATWSLSNSNNKLHFTDVLIFVEVLNLVVVVKTFQ